MKRALLAFLLCAGALNADVRQDIADSLWAAATSSNIDVRVLYTIAKTESDFQPYIISFLTSDTGLIEKLRAGFKGSIYRFRSAKYNSSKYAVSISSNSKEAMLELAKFFWDFDFNVDFGLMQISKQNLKKDELEFIFDPQYNVSKSKEILALCAGRYSSAKDAIECYNKGFAAKKNYDYYARFMNYFDSFFGEGK